MWCFRDVTKTMIFLAASLLPAGCGPERNLQWSADGSRVAFVSDGRLYRGDEQGGLPGLLAEAVERFEWFPDSQRILVVQKREIGDWRELADLSPLGFDGDKIMAAAAVAREELLGYSGKLDDFKPGNAASLTTEQWVAAALFLKQEGDPRLKQKLGDEWKKLDDLKVEIHAARAISARPGAAQDETPLISMLNEIRDIRMAPDGKALALVTRNGVGWMDAEEQSLLVCSAEVPGRPRSIARQVSVFPDWAPDSRDLYYLRCESPGSDSIYLGTIVRRTVRGETGEILQEPPDARDLVNVVSRGPARIRCLLDGRVLFAAIDVKLPAAIEDIPHHSTLFVLGPAPGLHVQRVIPPGSDPAVPDRADLFELSPDEKRAAVPGNKGRISVITLDTGEITAVVEKDGAADLRTVPVWRDARELCLLEPSGIASGVSPRDEITLWSLGGRRTISRGWPDAVMRGLGQ